MSADQFQDFLDILTGLSRKQKLVIASFEQRFILGKEHERLLKRFVAASKLLRNAGTDEEIQIRIQLLRGLYAELENKVLAPFLRLLMQEEQQEHAVVGQELRAEQALCQVFTDDFQGVQQAIAAGGLARLEAEAKLRSYMEKMSAALKNVQGNGTVTAALKKVLEKLDETVESEKRLIEREREVLLHYTVQGAVLVQRKDEVAQWEQMLRQLVDTISSALQYEREQVINPLNVLLKKKWDAIAKVQTIARQEVITLDDIKKDMRSFTSSAEVQQYVARILRVAQKFKKAENKREDIFRFLSSVGVGAEKLTEAAMEVQGRQIGLLRAELEKARALAAHDALTGVYARRAFEDLRRKTVELGIRTEQGVIEAVLDLDKFKQINDTYGHPVGDIVLQFFGNLMRASVRMVDMIGRIGGEEFAIIFQIGTTLEQAERLMNKLRARTEHISGILMYDINNKHQIGDMNEYTGLYVRKFENGELVVPPYAMDVSRKQITVSIGIAEMRPIKGWGEREIQDGHGKADSALYQAKKTRNKVVVFNETFDMKNSF